MLEHLCPACGAPSLSMPVLADRAADGVDEAALSFLLRRALEDKRKEEQPAKEKEEEERKQKVLDSLEQKLQQLLHESCSSSVQRRKRKKRRKKRLPRAPRPVAWHHGRNGPEGLLRAHHRQRQLHGQGWFYWLRFTSCVFPLVCLQARDVRHHGRYGPEVLLRDRARRRHRQWPVYGWFCWILHLALSSLP